MLLAPPALHRFFVLLIKAYARIVVVIFQPQEFWDPPLHSPLSDSDIQILYTNVAMSMLTDAWV